MYRAKNWVGGQFDSSDFYVNVMLDFRKINTNKGAKNEKKKQGRNVFRS